MPPHSPDDDDVRFEVAVRGTVRGREIAERRMAAVDGGALRLERLDDADRAARIPVARLDGVELDAGRLTLRFSSGDVLELTGSDRMGELAGAMDAAAFDIGELTRALRGVGSRRARPGSDHDRFFGPLLRARLAAAVATSPELRVAAIDATALGEEMALLIAALAADRHPDKPPDRRALEAELGELLDEMTMSLEPLDAAAAAFRAAPHAERYAAWRRWVAALRVTFAEADRAWLAALPVLADSRGAPGRFWRRVLGLGGRKSP